MGRGFSGLIVNFVSFCFGFCFLYCGKIPIYYVIKKVKSTKQGYNTPKIINF